MSDILKKYIPGLSMAFFATVFTGCFLKLLGGNDLDGFAVFVMEFAGYLIVAAGVDALVGKINFKSYFTNFMCEAFLLYPVTLLFAWLGNWFGMRRKMIFVFTIFFFLVMGIIHIYFYYMMKREADQINEYIKERKDE